MKVYLVSLGAGLLAGVVYSLLHVRSPAPPLVALVGLLGILIGEQLIPVGKLILAGNTLTTTHTRAQLDEHLFGQLPGHHQSGVANARKQTATSRSSRRQSGDHRHA
jgi:XapX domain-containing protein